MNHLMTPGVKKFPDIKLISIGDIRETVKKGEIKYGKLK